MAFTFDTTPPASASRRQSGQANRVAGERDARRARRRAARDRRTARSRIASELRPSARRSACPGRAVSMTPSRTRTKREQRILLVGNRRGVVGQRHHLAFVFELAHVEQVRDVLEEHAQRALAPATPRRAADARRETPRCVAERPSPRPSIVRTAHGAKPDAQAAAAACAS